MVFFYPTLLDERFLFAVRTRNLTLGWHIVSVCGPLIRNYLRHLGPELHSLHLLQLHESNIDEISTLDFTTNVNLVNLALDHVVYCDQDTREISVSPALISLLSGMPTCLQNLTLYLQIHANAPSLRPLSQLVERLGTTSLRTVQFIIKPSGYPRNYGLQKFVEDTLRHTFPGSRVSDDIRLDLGW
ncbi:hypothetical protein FB45DRAFT_337113 [Roridomyces roridus]|uniref:Uncharacterized protein n=1 Tax=Roridomyces roridus TaxID=1738132 RepID=A0AAD7FC60_9AGAR|nr:hypothetical protein FB45DRAFT_337113 [Roridomyces roridus]